MHFEYQHGIIKHLQHHTADNANNLDRYLLNIGLITLITIAAYQTSSICKHYLPASKHDL